MNAVLIEYEPYRPWAPEEEALSETGGELVAMSYSDFMAEAPDAELLLNAYAGTLGPATLDRMPSLRCAVGYGVGLDWVDLADVSARGIQIVNMPLANVEDVATHAFALALSCARRLHELDRHLREGGWYWPRSRPIHRLAGRRLGLVAFGKIPRRLAELARPTGLVVAAYDPYTPPDAIRALGVEPMQLGELVATSDILSIHVPSTPETRGLIDAELLATLPRGAIVVATSRGDVYDAVALAEGLADGRIAAAGIDVYPEEPLPERHPLRDAPTAILTPHVAGYSEESIAELHQTAATVIRQLARGETPVGLVNGDRLRPESARVRRSDA